ncbi:unnamed protein product [Arctia plantaginis]|uniref:Uncharacterized protein n=1 Tax=Arctia plantaginis TaxID=874455 RepID=A0A8S0YMT4_ARCPL|nr:unnamed protein product [Arctia plantaginis]
MYTSWRNFSFKMPPLSLEGNTLGEKHKHFNKLVRDAIANEQLNLTKINANDGEIDNLLKIETACKSRNVDYIIEVLKCDDMLYVSKAIKQSMWLITEQQYEYIINPEYLFTQLFPYMLTKAVNKLLLQIRLHLKDEKRVEIFYDYLKNHDKVKECDKWLLNCSIPFIENVINNQQEISLQLFKRLCKRSVKFLKYYKKVESRNSWRALKSVLFLIKSNTDEFLNVVEATKDYTFPTLGSKHTEVIMKKFPNRILDKFETYNNSVDLSVVTKYMKKETVKDFVLKQVKNENTKYFMSNYENLKHFIKIMPQEERFEFVKKIYIDKNVNAPALYDDMCLADDICGAAHMPTCSTNSYNWYQYAPFNEAFVELKKLIRAESSPAERCAILSVLIICAKKNPQNVKTVLQYYYDKHRNEPFKFKIQFVNNMIRQIPTYKFDSDTWNILEKLFHSLEVYTESENNVQTCLKSIVVYKVLHDETIPEIVAKKLNFDTFKIFQKKLNAEQQEKLFNYLLSSLTTKIQNNTIKTESDFQKSINLLTDALNLLIDWKKDLKENTFILAKLQESIKLKKANAWDVDLTSLYKMKKSWRKYMFEESMTLYPCEDVCLNALKHDPQLLARYSDKLDELRTNDTISLRRLLAKLRVYWQYSLAQEWIKAYLKNFNESTGHKAVIKGLFELLPHGEIEKIARKYSPTDPKIDYNEVDQIELSLRKNIAKNLYIARPLTSLDLVLLYAKGDYLQYAVPSLNSIIHNISVVQSRGHMSKLLEAPVSLQKYGLHLAFIKLKYEELKPIFSGIWKTTKNSTIRTHLFTHTYNILSKVKDPSVVKELWELLSMFIDNLGTDENKIIFSNLGKVKNVPVSVQGEFFKKSYNVLSSLPPGANCEIYKNNLIKFAPDIMDLLDTDFVENKLLGSIKEEISKTRCELTDIMAAYVLHGKTEEEQCEKFKRALLPALEHAFTSWNTVKDDEYVMKENVDSLTKELTWGIKKYLPLKKIIVPVKLFQEIEKIMAEKLSIVHSYELLTRWKLTTEYVKLLVEYKDMFSDPNLDNLPLSDFGNGWMPEAAERVWEAVHIKVSPKFGPIIVKHLKTDTEKYFPTICWLFSVALSKTFQNLSFRQNLMKMETLKHMVLNDNFIPSCIVVCEEMPVGKYCDEEEKKLLKEILKVLSAHPSLEVKMHYQKAFSDITFAIA